MKEKDVWFYTIVLFALVSWGLSNFYEVARPHEPSDPIDSSIKYFKNVTEFELQSKKLWWCRGKTIEVVDGDTIEMLLNCQRGEFSVETIRLWNVDTPETYRRPDVLSDTEWAQEQQAGKRVTEWVRDKILNREILVRKMGKGSFGRTLAILKIKGNDHTLNHTLRQKGHRRP
jgi:endonuclease YncB( thermonuclease family)